ncbi:MAG TPA: hypothetical protein VGM90_30725 [Kofleriaceae bacterium]|jgi:hypothetical protein
MNELRARLAAVPALEPELSADTKRLVEQDVAYLGSDEALALIARDPYWPKWDAPYWSMVLLWELGEAARIPQRAVDAMIVRMNAMEHFFPLRDEEIPSGKTIMDIPCHCQLGTIDQVLAARGVDVDAALPWLRPWFDRYQMADGGLNCDEKMYLVDGEVPSSMVGTIPGFEAMQRRGASVFVERAAAMVQGRRGCMGSHTLTNKEERDSAVHWSELTFPRFYLYDTLRGLTALVRWATAQNRTLPLIAIAHVVDDLCKQFPDGVVRIGRRAFAEHSQTRDPEKAIDAPRRLARTRPLLDAVSKIGDPSPSLTREWTDTRAKLLSLMDRGRVS